jgi:hypothetical protein
MTVYPPTVISSVLAELKRCLRICVADGLVGEGTYLKRLIEQIRKARPISVPKHQSLPEVNRRLVATEEQLERSQTKYASNGPFGSFFVPD